MASKLNMHQAQVNEFTFEIERVNRAMQELKKKYFEQKRKEQISLRYDLIVAVPYTSLMLSYRYRDPIDNNANLMADSITLTL
mmetsp:Transcript_6854/g.7476  ORF Transcript_6854/g.7476 Transcript_6854/m.7476 type:complete len:83 (-) Transcript_6854:714-962(-)